MARVWQHEPSVAPGRIGGTDSQQTGGGDILTVHDRLTDFADGVAYRADFYRLRRAPGEITVLIAAERRGHAI